jgi:hypothetical protein
MSQTAAILSHLKRGSVIDPLRALSLFGCFRLAARISELRQAGYRIDTRRLLTRTGKRVALYKLVA